VTSNSVNLLDELRNYQWLKKNGEKMNVPIDTWNHGIDATRYLFISKLGKKNNNKTPFIIGK